MLPIETARGLARVGAGEVLALASLAAGVLLLLPALGVSADASRIGPVVLAGLGVALLWRQADDEARARWRARALTRPSAFARTALGVALVAGGLALFLAARGELRQAREGLLGTVVVAGLALVTAPYWVRTVRELAAERRERIRSQERAEVAAHVHDSVLHTLALIRRHAADPAAVTRLARAQERDLRGWLHRRAPDAGWLRAAVEEAAAEVEDAHGVPVEVVAVGDCPLDERLAALVQAAREAMVNAARHSGAAVVSVYVEVEPDQAALFVRDRGRGFDPDAVPDERVERLGLRESVLGRAARHGGRAEVRSAPGEGTEVRLRMPRGAA